eukprot:684777_1
MSSSHHFPEQMPKMTTKESNGEVSASITETNRVRALLGLKPLNVGCAPSVPSRTHKDNNKPQQNSPESTDHDIEALHHKLRSKHASESLIRGISLSEELGRNALENYSAALWVQKSRDLEAQKKEERSKSVDERMSELYEEEDVEDVSHLCGKIVNHDVESFKSGESKILILKDQKILDAQMNINTDEDELINVKMYEKEVRNNRLNEIENKKRNRSYNPLDEDNYNVLLPQYKEKQDVTKNKRAFALNDTGNMDRKIIQSLNDHLGDTTETNGIKEKMTRYDLTQANPAKQVGSDYMIKFKKKKKHKKKRKKKRKRVQNEEEEVRRKKQKLDDGASGSGRGIRDEILSALKASEIEEKEEKERMFRYNMAMNKANESMAQNLAMNDMINKLEHNDDDDAVFNNTLHRAQVLKEKQLQNNNDLSYTKIEDEEEEEEEEGIVFSIASQFSDGLNNAMSQMNDDDDEILSPMDDAVDSAVIVDDSNTSAGGWVECVEEAQDKTQAPAAASSSSAADNRAEHMTSSILDREPLCNRSLSDTLSHIRRRGFLDCDDITNPSRSHVSAAVDNIGISRIRKEQIKEWGVDDVVSWLRRSDSYLYKKYGDNFLRKRIDGKQLMNSCGCSSFLRGVIGMKNGHLDISKFMNILGELKGDPAPDIALTHNDQYGEPMTAKEAFRKLSHKFHGKKSGPKKEEKRLKKRMMELQRKKENNIKIDTPRQTLTKLKETTKQINKPFVVLDKH